MLFLVIIFNKPQVVFCYLYQIILYLLLKCTNECSELYLLLKCTNECSELYTQTVQMNSVNSVNIIYRIDF